MSMSIGRIATQPRRLRRAPRRQLDPAKGVALAVVAGALCWALLLGVAFF